MDPKQAVLNYLLLNNFPAIHDALMNANCDVVETENGTNVIFTYQPRAELTYRKVVYMVTTTTPEIVDVRLILVEEA